MARSAGDVCDTRCQLFHKELIRNENRIRMRWFVKNQERLIENLREPKLMKRAREAIESAKKREEKVRIDKPAVKRKPLPRWRPLEPDDSVNVDIMKPVDPSVRALLYEKKVPTFIAADSYLTERYKELPEKRYYFPDSQNWTYGWRLGDFPPVPPSKLGLKSVMIAQFYQRTFNLLRDPKWYRGCQTKNARNFNELLTY
ncbi:uncharacterized protein LOC109853689 [Pseudomyrmex gracilis]|uniref:uncharacterized protein LOC109853689 n=1 Tax=Pseudomyrmex gracilis TaxID=219809 RepID=UPI00099545B2|nr:uncharacterized protein LOC109853689 [Pseudomyrmex gracilis]